ncbi:MAG: FAD-dependent 5-carboxymethylaminomethyl-2-thiouridine(34) oxidoreductase MnmC, partial [Pseudomonadota bacterium]|nr:FAD-dependent 5-carboxymethylaminomethyl-2-thiouridine(34) oxidoreductase MnmC [Pseudomonadota bacterium]
EEHGVDSGTDGLLRLEAEAMSLADMRATVARLGLPIDYVRVVTAEEASSLAGVTIDAPAWFYPRGGWVDPRGLARSFLARAADRVDVRLGVDIASLQHGADERWLLFDADGRELASARTVVLANAGAAAGLLEASGWPIERRRGQISASAASSWAGVPRPRLPIAGAGYVLPPIDGQIWFGATSQTDDGDLTLRRDDQCRNLDRLARLLAMAPSLDVDDLRGRVSFRYVAVDRLPLVGAVPVSALGARLRHGLAADESARPEQPRFAPRAPGLFVFTALGSRGIAWSAVGAQVVASAISGAPAPLEADLLDAIDPARFASRLFRRAGAATAGRPQRPEGPMAAGSAPA